MISLTLVALSAALQAATPAPEASAISEGLDFYCLEWMAAPEGSRTAAGSARAVAAGWREQRSAAPAVGPILVKGGPWGQASVVRVTQNSGNRCSMAIQLSSRGWTTEPAYAAVAAWATQTWPSATLAKTRGDGPRGTRETVWRQGQYTLTLQEAPEAGAQPNVFITLLRDREI